MLVFDSDAVPVRERHGALVDSITSAAEATFMTPARGDDHLHMRMDLWDLAGIQVYDTRCSAHTLRRSARQAARDDGEPLLAVTSALRGRGTHLQREHERTVEPFSVWATNMSEPYVHQVSDTWTITAKLPLHLLGVPEGLAIPALEQVGRSPLAPLFSHHLVEVRRVGDDLDEATAAALGTATLALARALVTSVSSDERLGRQNLDDVLMLRITAYVRQHLRDPGLGPASTAAALHVSLRQLYRTCARAEIQLEQWIIEQRLERIHEELARATPARAPVTVLAQQWGFTSAAHFTRRFRAAYGMSPREWQAMNR